MNYEISIIVLNYYTDDITIKCLKSIEKQIFKDFFVVLVNNGSKEPEKLEKMIKKLRIKSFYLEPARNLGYAGGVNHALRKFNSKYVALINSDSLLSKSFLKETKSFLDKNTSFAACSPWIAKNGSLWFKKAKIAPWRRFIAEHVSHISTGDQKEIIDCDYLPMTAILIRRKTLELTNLLPTEFFLYYEDAFWGVQIRRLGYKLASIPKVLAFHAPASSSKFSIRNYFMPRSKLIFTFKVFRGINLLIATFGIIINLIIEIVRDIKYLDQESTRNRLAGIKVGLQWLKSNRFYKQVL